ncbi:multi-sensor hybrid histidine kinase [Nostoc carneum NIES-2107]|nr:multi-sensor hybrid histidine kinase [Nostoc carneum NIES-2107]
MLQHTVLIVDDCPEDREIYRRYLASDRQHSYTILEEELGEPALALCQKMQPDAILLDFVLPDLDGLEFLAVIQQSLTNPPPVIMVTGHGNETVAVQAMKNGAKDYLIKGKTTSDSLQLAMRCVIDNTRLRQELQQSQEQFCTSIENMLDCFGIYSAIRDAAGRIEDFCVEYVNEAACKANQMTKAEQMGKRLCEILPGHRDSGLFDEYCQVVETGNPLRKESLIYTDVYGQQVLTRAFDIHVSKWKDGFVASWRDVTERKQAEIHRHQLLREERAARKRAELAEQQYRKLSSELQESEQRFRAIFNSTFQFIGLLTPDGILLEANQTALDFAGLTAAEVINRPFWEARWWQISAQTQAQLRQAINRAAGGEFVRYEVEVLGAGNQVLTIDFSLQPICNDSGEIILLIPEGRDISDRKYLEQTLRENEARFRQLADAIPQIVWTTTADGQTEYNNQQWFEYTGLTLEQTQQLGWQTALHPDDLQRAYAIWTSALQTGSFYQAEYRYQRAADNTYRWHLVRATPLKNEQGEVIKWFGSCTDIEDQKQIEAERNRLLMLEQAARVKAEEASRAKDEFITVVSHDLRSPLNSILGWTKLLQKGNLDAVTTSRALDAIERGVTSQVRLIEDLLDISRVIRGTLELQISTVDLISIVESAVTTAHPLAIAKDISLNYVLPKYIAQITGDAQRLQQVLSNLLANAIKFTPNSGQVEIKLEQIKTQIQISVSDTGCGINAEFLPHIFDRYRQESGTHKKAGLGLGLAISRHIIELHGGTISATSPGEGQGATFTIQLPIFRRFKQV